MCKGRLEKFAAMCQVAHARMVVAGARADASDGAQAVPQCDESTMVG